MTTRYIVRFNARLAGFQGKMSKEFKRESAALKCARDLRTDGETVTLHSYDVADGIETAVEF